MSGFHYTALAVAALLAANAFFVAAEFALVKARGFRVAALAEERRFGARLTVRIQGRLEAYLAACQLGITMASLGLGWVGEPAVEAMLRPVLEPLALPAATMHTIAFLVGFVAFSSLHIVVGEQVPKTFAIRQAEPVSLWCAYPLHAFYLLVFPLNWALNRASGGILALFGVEEATHADVVTDEELRGIITTSREHGSIEEARARILSNLFAFDERTVGRIMVPRGDVERATGLEVPADLDANTLSGLFNQRLGRMPEVGDVVEEAGYRLEVAEMGEHRVERVAMRVAAPPEDAGDGGGEEAGDG